MKAAVMQERNGTPTYGEFDEPRARADQEVVELVAAGVHPLVRALASGRHYGSGTSWPLVPGVDAVARTSQGGLVYTGYVEAPFGTFAERMAVPAGMSIPLPAEVDAAQVAAGLNPGLSSWLPLRKRAATLDSLATVLVLGVTGMAGALAVQNARLLGATRVVGVGRNASGLTRARRLGAEPLELTGDRGQDAQALAEILDGQAPTLVLDFVWGGVAETAFEALGRRGLHDDAGDIAYVEIGAIGGPEAKVPGALLRSRRITISGSGAGSTPMAVMRTEIPIYLHHIADGTIDVPAQAFPLSEIGAAWEAATSGGPRPVVVPG
jgi:NADPH:quinone reductase-like Zn-dependent oxidoreductase